jgi:putative tricarboxylic transport membrane protein
VAVHKLRSGIKRFESGRECMEKYHIFPIFFWIGVSLFIAVLSYQLGLGGFHNPGPGLWPFILGILLLIISLYLFLRHLFKMGAKGETVKEEQGRIGFWRISLVLVLLFAYSLLLEKLGYLIATFMLLSILSKSMGSKKWTSVLIGSVLTVLVTYFVFTSLGLRFPKGILQWR